MYSNIYGMIFQILAFFSFPFVCRIFVLVDGAVEKFYTLSPNIHITHTSAIDYLLFYMSIWLLNNNKTPYKNSLGYKRMPVDFFQLKHKIPVHLLFGS